MLNHTKPDRPLRRRLLLLLLAALMALAFTGCGETETAEVPEETPTPVYTLHYWLGDKLLQTQTHAEGQYPAHLELTFAGLRFIGWSTDDGTLAQPEQVAMTADVDYYAVIYPVLDNHVPYLFPDADGFLQPDAPLTSRALDAAIRALASPGAAAYLPTLTVTDDPLTPDALRQTLLELYPAEEVDAAMQAYAGSETVLRRDAAVIFNTLLGRNHSETITLRRDAGCAPDVPAKAAEYGDLLEASVSHVVDEWGESWENCEIPGIYEPGFLPLHGKLYCIGEDGFFVTDSTVDGFTFGPDGVYTSGDETLDGYVTDILGTFAAEHPDYEPLELLRLAFEYARDSFTYFRKPALTFGETGWQTEYAVEMLSTQRGNCYNYASVFWALARGLGYDAKAYSGSISQQPHGWVEIDFDGVTYLFDPELEMAARERGQMNSDRFMMTKQAAAMYGVYYRTT